MFEFSKVEKAYLVIFLFLYKRGGRERGGEKLLNKKEYKKD
jgi:hypothetical protein